MTRIIKEDKYRNAIISIVLATKKAIKVNGELVMTLGIASAIDNARKVVNRNHKSSKL